MTAREYFLTRLAAGLFIALAPGTPQPDGEQPVPKQPAVMAPSPPAEDVLAPPPSREMQEKREAQVRAEGEATHARAKKIEDELAALENHEWAGEYSTGAGLSGLVFVVAPKAGFAYFQWTDIGDFDVNYGAVKDVLADRLILQPAADPNVNEPKFFAPEMYRVRWGERRYMVSRKGMIEFCNEYNSGTLERHGGPFILSRKGDDQKPVAGVPSVPPDFARYILAKPIQAKIARIESNESGEMPRGMHMRWTTIRATLDAGSSGGALLGMRFYVNDGKTFKWGVVVAVTDASSTVEFRDYTMDGQAAMDPKVGWEMSTRHWMNGPPAPDKPAGAQPPGPP